jgi:hypothetical protein
MKKTLLGFAVSGLAFLIGLFVATTLANKDIAQPIVDLAEYSIEVTDLAIDPARYDGKIIHITGSFHKMPTYELGILEGEGIWMRVICVAEEHGCRELFRPRGSEYVFDRDVAIEVLGRFRNDAFDPHPKQRGEKVRLLEIHKVLSVEPRWDTNPGGGYR